VKGKGGKKSQKNNKGDGCNITSRRVSSQLVWKGPIWYNLDCNSNKKCKKHLPQKIPNGVACTPIGIPRCEPWIHNRGAMGC